MRKVVGDGRSIQAFRDPWIPQPRTFRPITAAPSGSVMGILLVGLGGPRGDVSGVGDGVVGGVGTGRARGRFGMPNSVVSAGDG
ncbi:hypothetical protein G4B88_001686 [Cannabis sativa]|uniref:Uncharacterized protein n=1 Tax=Cannabis sativa TaxID=3483 RepID=A0A7J6I1P6_CANSA|nr:hypothetical protein G4B88_001686 [Cannabis sativa]